MILHAQVNIEMKILFGMKSSIGHFLPPPLPTYFQGFRARGNKGTPENWHSHYSLTNMNTNRTNFTICRIGGGKLIQ